MMRSLATSLNLEHRTKKDWDKITRRRASIEKAKKLLDYQPQTEFEAGLKKVHDWLVENQENIKRDAEF